MRKLVIEALVLAALVIGCIVLAVPVRAQETASLFDVDKRLSVTARAYRSFDEVIGTAGSYSSDWWSGLALAYSLTSPHDPSVKLPCSLIGALDIGLPSKRVRGYIGIGFQLKKAAP